MAARAHLVKALAATGPICLRRRMTSGPDDRKERLAQALRDNLRRRKAQARAVTTEPPPAKPDPDR